MEEDDCNQFLSMLRLPVSRIKSCETPINIVVLSSKGKELFQDAMQSNLHNLVEQYKQNAQTEKFIPNFWNVLYLFVSMSPLFDIGY